MAGADRVENLEGSLLKGGRDDPGSGTSGGSKSGLLTKCAPNDPQTDKPIEVEPGPSTVAPAEKAADPDDGEGG